MPTYLALLRGVNVGRSKRVPMAELRSLLSGLGYARVATLLNSGNAVFHCARGSPARLAAVIAAAISDELALEVPVVVKSAREWSSIVDENPLARVAPDHSRLLVAFVQDVATLASLERVGMLATPPERFVMGRHAAYLHCANGIVASRAGAALLGKAGHAATTRNWATVLKLQRLAGAGEGWVVDHGRVDV